MYYQVVGVIIVCLGLFISLALFITIEKEGCSECRPWILIPALATISGVYLILRKKRN